MRKMTRKPPWPAGDDHKKPDTTSIRYVLGVAQKYTAGTGESLTTLPNRY